MKKFNFTFILFCLGLISRADYWTQKANYPGSGLSNTFSFSIGNKGYVGCGRNSLPAIPFNDFWEWDQTSNVWTQKASFGGVARSAAVGFSIGSKGYAGTGNYSNGTNNTLNDFWEYDPATNLWTQKANFTGQSRYLAIGFSIGNMGYIGTGYHFVSYYNDFWQYDPLIDTWTQKASLPSFVRRCAKCFVIGDYAYVVGGNNNGTMFNDLWQYNSVSNTWLQKANFPAGGRADAAAFSICDIGYFGTGEYSIGGVWTNDFWQYNPLSDIWIQKTNFLGTSRDESACFSIGNKGYIGLGGHTANPVFNDFWEYTPDSACTTGMEELTISNFEFSIISNPVKDFLTISFLLLNENEKLI